MTGSREFAIWTSLPVSVGFERDRKIRDLIKRWAPALGEIQSRPTVGRASMPKGGTRPVAVDEFWLTEAQALFITVKSDAPEAIKVTQELIGTFLAMRDALRDRAFREQPVIQRLINAFLLPKPTDEWERMFPASLVKEFCGLHGVKWVEGTPHPRFLASTNRKIYDMIFSAPVGAELKARNPEPRHGSNHHQTLTPEARTYFATQLGVVEAIAHGSNTKAEFWARMERQYAGGMLQLTIGAQS